MKFAPKKSAPKWTSNKMGNAKKGHNKMGRSIKSCTLTIEQYDTIVFKGTKMSRDIFLYFSFISP